MRKIVVLCCVKILCCLLNPLCDDVESTFHSHAGESSISFHILRFIKLQYGTFMLTEAFSVDPREGCLQTVHPDSFSPTSNIKTCRTAVNL